MLALTLALTLTNTGVHVLTLMLGYRKLLLKILTSTHLIVYKIIDIIYIFYAVTVFHGKLWKMSVFCFKVLVKSYF